MFLKRSADTLPRVGLTFPCEGSVGNRCAALPGKDTLAANNVTTMNWPTAVHA